MKWLFDLINPLKGMKWLFDQINPLKGIAGALSSAYEKKLAAQNATERIEADKEIAWLEARRDALVASVGEPWWSPRSIMGYAVALYVAKIVFIDSTLQLGVTPYPGEQVTWIVVTIIGFYFVSRSAETIANSLTSAFKKK
jgi:hypothetical protein